MRRYALPAMVVLADGLVTLAAGPGRWPAPPLMVAYLVAATAVVALGIRSAPAGLVAALVLATASGAGFVLLIWSAYQAGRAVWSRWDPGIIGGAVAGAFAVRFVLQPGGPRTAAYLAVEFAVFVLTPLLAGRYVAQQRLLVEALDQRNAQLRRRRELGAEQERLRERLRIARDMHDALGRRLSLVSIQAAALEVSALPAERRDEVHRLADAARGAADELHRLVGALRTDPTEADTSTVHGGQMTAISALMEEFRAAGVDVSQAHRGQPRPMSTVAGQVAYRVVEEGLTNAVKHAPGQPVTVSLDWESDALLLTVVNPAGATPGRRAPGHGLAGLAERLEPVGGLLDSGRRGDGFRLFAMLPVAADGADPRARPAPVGRLRLAVVGIVTAALVFVVVPASMLFGVR